MEGTGGVNGGFNVVTVGSLRVVALGPDVIAAARCNGRRARAGVLHDCLAINQALGSRFGRAHLIEDTDYSKVDGGSLKVIVLAIGLRIAAHYLQVAPTVDKVIA